MVQCDFGMVVGAKGIRNSGRHARLVVEAPRWLLLRAVHGRETSSLALHGVRAASERKRLKWGFFERMAQVVHASRNRRARQTAL